MSFDSRLASCNIVQDILPYIASYVIMALVLQISSAILAEAGLSILGLGPKTTEVPTLGLMMNWAMISSAHVLNKWWALLPVILVIALIAFSTNLMITGLDQIFNPALRDQVSDMAKVMLEVKGLTTKYITRYKEDVYAVDHVSLKVEEGKSLGIAGESGCASPPWRSA